MFRKPKKSNKAKFRKRSSTDNNDDDTTSTSQLKKKRNIRSRDDSESDEEDGGTSQVLQQLKREAQGTKRSSGMIGASTTSNKKKKNVMHEYDATETNMTAEDLATRQAEYHPTELTQTKSEKEKPGTSTTTDDTADTADAKLYKGQTKQVNKFHAGPIRAAANIRTTCRFDYQPDVCKDYKETGFCGFGDSCIYLHIRGDTKTGWQLEAEWEERKKKEQEQKEKEMDLFCQTVGSGGIGIRKTRTGGGDDDEGPMEDDGIPFACFLCRNAFLDPVVTSCGHYFCQKCILDELKQNGGTSSSCPICQKDTQGVFNFPTKLNSKKKRLLGTRATWEEYKTYCEKRMKE